MLGKASTFSATICALAVALAATPAQATVGAGMLPLAVAASAFAPQADCAASLSPANGAARQEFAAPASKMAALLGGQPSQLDLIAQQQAAPVRQIELASFQSTLEPAAGPSFGIVTRARECQPQLAAVAGASQPAVYAPAPVRSPLGPGDFLASKRIAIGRTGLDNAWDRVRDERLPRGLTRNLMSASHGQPGKESLAAVNSWANARIRYIEDRALYGKSDYWAPAAETLRRGAGDCEDIAIAKMQLLAAMGVPREAMFLTIARDLARAADHAVLIVRLGEENWMLDNATDQVLDARQSHDYRPIISFSGSEKWLHGY